MRLVLELDQVRDRKLPERPSRHRFLLRLLLWQLLERQPELLRAELRQVLHQMRGGRLRDGLSRRRFLLQLQLWQQLF